MTDFLRAVTIRYPSIGGDQVIAPITNWFSPVIKINLGQSGAPAVEEDVLNNVGSYGKQLGRLGDALAVLLEHFEPKKPLERREKDAIDALKGMLVEIGEIKRRHGRV